MTAHREKLAISLDVDDLAVALGIAKAVEPWFGVAKVGFELFGAAGPPAVTALREMGFVVFLDLKLHDIPTTVGRAARVLGRLGVSYLNFHTLGGLDMLRAGVEGLTSGASEAGHTPPVALGVTVLTSDADATAETLAQRASLAAQAGCGGVVCAAGDIATIRAVAPGLIAVTPGLRLEGDPVHDQQRSATPREALDAGSSVLVVGRSVTAAPSPAEAAAAVAQTLVG